MKFYTYKTMQDELREQGLPWTRTFLQPLENLGVIPKVENTLEFHRKNLGLSRMDMRIFTREEIDIVIEIVRQYKLKHNDTNTDAQKS